MKKNLLFLVLIFISSSLFAYIDSDMDGVEDKFDQCPNTSLLELVDINGCTKRSLFSPHNFDIIAGINYSDSDYRSLNKTDTLSQTLQVDYYYKKFSLQASTSFFNTQGSGYSDSGLYDSFLGASYQFNPIQPLSVRIGVGVILPTYDTSLNNNNTDYASSVNVSYALNKFNLFGGYSFTMVNDDDVIVDGTNYTYQDTNALSAGAGYYLSDKLYMSTSYNKSDSIYTTVEDIETASLYGYYNIDKHWFAMFTFAKGLSDSASKNYLSARIGYFF